jgi:hypothetical protein
MRNVRANYVNAFNRHFAQMKAGGQNVYAEIRFEYGGPKRHELYRQAVMDVIVKDSEGAVSGTRIVTSPIQANYSGLPIVSSVAWHALVFRCKLVDFPEAELVAWGTRWISDEDPPLGSQDGLTGIIHFVSEPEERDGIVEFEVDFGSAPFEAFEELTEMLGDRIVEVLSYDDCDA